MLITFPDGNKREYEKDTSALQIAESISSGLARTVVAAKVNGKILDVREPLNEDCNLELIKFESKEGKDVYWHSTAHLLAQAVQELYPEVKVAIGPSIEDGFYYDFDRETAFTDEELEEITQKMKELAKNKFVYERRVVSRDEALSFFQKKNEDYKVELLEAIGDDQVISMYTQGGFTDLCRGPHLPDTGMIKAIKLLKTSGAYWRGDEKNKMLKRIYGISFPSTKELSQYLANLEEAKKRDHRILGKDLDLFSFSSKIGAGLVLWHPKGALIRHLIESFWKVQHLKNGYNLVNTPHMGKAELWETSGHLGFYNESMYAPMSIDEQDYYIKPMNCPFQIEIYNDSKKSYRQLPVRYAEMGTVYRYERAGTLHGLMRVRGFTQDDAHIICTKEQMSAEVKRTVEFSIFMLKSFGFEDFEIYLSTKPTEKFVGDAEDWTKAETALQDALEELNIEFQVDEGGGAFYGPKIDIKIKDALGRAWQCSTIQFDFNLPTRFNMEYVGADNSTHRPYMIHRALLGSLERFFATLLEFHGGNLPMWLAPEQVRILPVSDLYIDYSQKVCDELTKQGFRVSISNEDQGVSYKIRAAEKQKIPYMLICGEKEEKSGTVSIRQHTKGDIGSFKLNELSDILK